MEYRPLGRTGLKVSVIGLGTMTWGEQNSEADAHRQLDLALERGINLIDAAEMYPVPPKPETQGRTEAHIGSWIAARKNRDRYVLATKVAGSGQGRGADHLRDFPLKLDRRNIRHAIEASLRRLRTDYVDFYQIHWSDRTTNAFGRLGYTTHAPDPQEIPIEETLSYLGELVKEGKVRHLGVSNETPWGVMTYLDAAARKGLPRIAAVQNPYSLLNRSFEIGLAEIAFREDVPLIAYSPLGMGVLSGKYLGGAKPAGARLTLFSRFGRYSNPVAVQATAEYVEIARKAGLDPAQMALAFVNAQGFLASNLVGATTIEQLEANIASANLKLSRDVRDAIEAVHKKYSSPAS